MTVMQFMKKDINSIKKGGHISGKKTFGCIMDLNLSKMKEYCKKQGCTVNDYCASLMSVSLREYLHNEEQAQIQNGDTVYPVPDSVRFAIPFSLRQPFKSLSDVKMCNDFGSLYMDMAMNEDLDKALAANKITFKKLKDSL